MGGVSTDNTCVLAAACSKLAGEVVDSGDSVLYVMKNIQSCTYNVAYCFPAILTFSNL